MPSKNLKAGKKAKVKTSTDIDALSGGSSECESKTETTVTTGFAVGTKNIPALFWNPMLSISGKKGTRVKKGSGND